jgi:predicted GTPase
MNDMVDESQQYYFIATMIASIVGFVLAFVVNRFVNKMDDRMTNFDRMFDAIQKSISELEKISAVHDNEIENIKGKVFNVRYPKK